MFSAFATLLRIIVFLALAGFLVAFVGANTEIVTLSLYPLPYEVDIALHALCLLLLFLGMLVGGAAMYLGGAGKRIRLSHQLKKCEKERRAMENELQALRIESMPFQPSQVEREN